MTAERDGRWWDLKPWHTNMVLVLIGAGLVGFTKQLIREYDPQVYYFIGFSGVSTAQLALYVGALAVLLIRPANVNRYTLGIIFAVAITCRLVAVLPDPALSSDVYRYAWDGVVQHAHVNPYRYVPGDKALTFLRAPNQDLFDNMNRRDYAHTIYPPVAQMLFYAITFINPTVTFMKLAMVLFEGATVWGLLRMLRYLGMQREWIIIYAWMPMLVWEFAGSGHLDSMVMAFVVWAMVFRYRRQPVWTGVFLGLAILTKFYPLVVVPAFWMRRGWRVDWKMPAVMAAMAVASYAVYLSAGKMVFGFLGGYVQEEGMATGTRYFLLELAQRVPGLHGLSNTAFVLFTGAVFAGLMVWAWLVAMPVEGRRDAFLAPAMALALALMVLFSPHYPWYVAWLVPFMVVLPNLTVTTYVGGLFYLCTTALAVGYGPQQYHLNEILYGAVTIAFVVEVCLRENPRTRAWYRGLIARSPVEPALDAGAN